MDSTEHKLILGELGWIFWGDCHKSWLWNFLLQSPVRFDTFDSLSLSIPAAVWVRIPLLPDPPALPGPCSAAQDIQSCFRTWFSCSFITPELLQNLLPNGCCKVPVNPTNTTWRCHQSCFSCWRIWCFLWDLKSPDIPRAASHLGKVIFSWGSPGCSHLTPSRLFLWVISTGNCFYFFLPLKNQKWQNIVDFWTVRVCYFMSGIDFFPLLFVLLEIVIPTCRVPSWAARIWIWTPLLLFVFCFFQSLAEQDMRKGKKEAWIPLKAAFLLWRRPESIKWPLECWNER